MSESLTKVIDFCQGRAPYHTDAAEVRPRLPNLCTPMVLDERRGSVQFRRSELHAVNHELVRQLQLLRPAAARDVIMMDCKLERRSPPRSLPFLPSAGACSAASSLPATQLARSAS